MNKTVLTFFTILCLLSTVFLMGLAFNTQTVKSSGTIYIRADGSIDPPATPIQQVGNIYTLKWNIYDALVVERSNIIVDGDGYTLQGSGIGIGINLTATNNVTIKNMEIKAFFWGVYLSESSNNSIIGNNITENLDDGILLWESSGNTVSGNNITNNDDGILLWESSNNSIIGNNITENLDDGIYLYYSSNNTIYHNNFIGNVQQVDILKSGYTNFWDDNAGKGNYWSDYEDRYPDAEEIDESGIWDTPYFIDENNQDNYPIIPEFPSFLILPLFMTATLLIVIVYRRKHTM